MKSTQFRLHGAHRGMALMMVIVALGILVLVAIPFAISMRVEQRASDVALLKTRARLGAISAMNYAMARLSQGCDNQERYVKQEPPYQTPSYDSPQEYEVNILIPGLDVQNPKGDLWSVYVEDEQGKININSATPWLLGNLMGSALVKASATPVDKEIVVDTTYHFPKQGGYVWINGELIHYDKTDGNRFLDCQRGVYSDSPRFSEAQTIAPGTLVIDARAYRICQHRLAVRPGRFTPFRTVEEIRQIADLGAYAIEAELFARLAPFLTVSSGRSLGYGWMHGQKIRDHIQPEEASKADILHLADASFYRPGLTIKIQENEDEAYAMLRTVNGNQVSLDARLPRRFTAEKAMVWVMENHPININSAHPKVLFSLLKGMQTSTNWIDGKEAAILASAIVGWREESGGIRSLEHLAELLKNLQQDLHIPASLVMDEEGRAALQDEEIHAVLSVIRNMAGGYKRFRGINVPQIHDQSYPPFPSMSSLIFRNHDTYHLETTAVINSPTGIPLAEHTLERIVTVAPLVTQRWCLDSQEDFAEQMARLPSWRVITWPKFVHYFNTLPDGKAATEGTGLTLDTVPLYPRTPTGITGIQYEPWNNTYDGGNCPEPDQPKLLIRSGELETLPGAVSFWFHPKPSTAQRHYLFEMGKEEWCNYVACFYEDGRLTLRVSDSTCEQTCAEISAPFTWQEQWYHLVAAWYTTAPGGLALWVDGIPLGTFCYRNEEGTIKAVLQKALTPTSKVISLDTGYNFPGEGVVKIGDEVIEYEARSGSNLVVRQTYEGFEVETLCRGARGTEAKAHPAGVSVFPFGYSDTLESKIFPASRLTTHVAQEKLYAKLSMPITATATTIPVNDTAKFPKIGYLLLLSKTNNAVERVHYSGTGGDSFAKCQRGALESKAQEFLEGYAFPISICVEDNQQYDESGIVQIEEEWIAYERKVDNNWLIWGISKDDISDFRKVGHMQPACRGLCSTMSAYHDTEVKVQPVFQTRLGWSGRHDKVTLVADNNPDQLAEFTIQWASGNYAALVEDVKRVYTPGKGTRLLKFPSGELPIKLTSPSWGRSAIHKGTTAFGIDELTWLQASSRAFYCLTKPLLAQSTEMTVNSAQFLPRDGGIIKIEDEYIGMSTDMDKGIQKGERGFAWTAATVHDAGATIFPIFFLPVSTLSTDITAPAGKIPLLGAQDFAREGYVRCGAEIIGYSQVSGQNLLMPENRAAQGICRGAFGTTADAHRQGALVYVMPARYWDRAPHGYDGHELAYFGAARSAPGALWERLNWEEEIPSPALGIEIHARIDGKPDWDEPPTNKAGGIFAFTEAEAMNRLNVPGDTLEIRVYFVYHKSAWSDGAWKQKARLKSLWATYRQVPKVWENR